MNFNIDLHIIWADLTINSIFIVVVSTEALPIWLTTEVSPLIFILNSLLMR